MSDLKKLLAAKKMSGDMQELLTRLKGALETIQTECNRQDERITELEKSLESVKEWNSSRMNCLTDKQNDIQAALENFEQKSQLHHVLNQQVQTKGI